MSRVRGTLIVGLVAIAALVCGCASLRALSSTPPIKSIVLDQAAEIPIGWGTKLTMPAGEYKPVLEDKAGYYYQAPSKFAIRDIFSKVLDGGLIVARDEKSPSRWYTIECSVVNRRGPLPKNFTPRAVE